MPAEMRFIVKENIIRGMYDNGNLMIYAAIANDGVMMTPYLVDHYLDADGNVVEQTKPKALRSVCTKAEAELMDEFLTYVITNGTAAAGGSQYARVSGKTGSAQYDSTKNYHAWFCGYGTNDDECGFDYFVDVSQMELGEHSILVQLLDEKDKVISEKDLKINII